MTDYVGACFRQGDGNRCAESGGGTSDQRCLTVKFELVEDHCYFLLASSPEPD